jgi:hypothetical protein
VSFTVKRRTQHLANIVQIFCLLGVIGTVIELGGEAPGRAIGPLALGRMTTVYCAIGNGEFQPTSIPASLRCKLEEWLISR